MSDPITTLPNLLEALDQFKRLSNLKINFNKLMALNVSLNPQLASHCKAVFLFRWQKVSVKYLGIDLPSSLDALYSLNYTPLLRSIALDLQKRGKVPLSWFAKVAFLKMNVLPRILYVLQVMPVALPPPFFASLRKIFMDFIWAGGNPRNSLMNLSLPKNRGGLGLPDIQRYYWSCHMARIVDWNAHGHLKDWVSFEQTFLTNTPALAPWSPTPTPFRNIPDLPETY